MIGFIVFVLPATYIFFKEWEHPRKERASILIVLCFVAFGMMSSIVVG